MSRHPVTRRRREHLPKAALARGFTLERVELPAATLFVVPRFSETAADNYRRELSVRLRPKPQTLLDVLAEISRQGIDNFVDIGGLEDVERPIDDFVPRNLASIPFIQDTSDTRVH